MINGKQNRKFNLRNTPDYGDLSIEFYGEEQLTLNSFFGGVLNISEFKDPKVLFDGQVKENSIYTKIVNKLNFYKLNYVRIREK